MESDIFTIAAKPQKANSIAMANCDCNLLSMFFSCFIITLLNNEWGI